MAGGSFVNTDKDENQIFATYVSNGAGARVIVDGSGKDVGLLGKADHTKRLMKSSDDTARFIAPRKAICKLPQVGREHWARAICVRADCSTRCRPPPACRRGDREETAVAPCPCRAREGSIARSSRPQVSQGHGRPLHSVTPCSMASRESAGRRPRAWPWRSKRPRQRRCAVHVKFILRTFGVRGRAKILKRLFAAMRRSGIR